MSDTQLKPTVQELKELIARCNERLAFPIDGFSNRHTHLAKQLAQAELDRRATEGSGDVEALIAKLPKRGVPVGFPGDQQYIESYVSVDDLRAFLSSLLSKQVPDGLVEELKTIRARKNEQLSAFCAYTKSLGLSRGDDAHKIQSNAEIEVLDKAIAFIAGQGQQKPDAVADRLRVLQDENAKLWGWVNDLAQKRQPQSAPTQAAGKRKACVCSICLQDQPICDHFTEGDARGHCNTRLLDGSLCCHDRACHKERP